MKLCKLNTHALIRTPVSSEFSLMVILKIISVMKKCANEKQLGIVYFYLYLKRETILISKMDYLAGDLCSVSNQQLHGSSVLVWGFVSQK